MSLSSVHPYEKQCALNVCFEWGSKGNWGTDDDSTKDALFTELLLANCVGLASALGRDTLVFVAMSTARASWMTAQQLMNGHHTR